MKRTISLLLATLMVVAMLPVFGIAASAEGDAPVATTTYVVYEEDFEGVDTDKVTTTDTLLEALGWYVPSAKAGQSFADYTIVTDDDGNQSLCVSTDTLGVQGITTKSFVTVFGGDIMSVVRNGNFTLSYTLTYDAATTNTNGYSAMIYNYNEKSGQNNGEAYGIVAVRACGTGLNSVYYPVSGGSVYAQVEDAQNNGELVMSNRYERTGNYPSLYARIANTVGDENYNADAETTLAGSDKLIGKKLEIVIEYDNEDGVCVVVNGVKVSEPNKETIWDKLINNGIWDDFIDRTTGAAIGLVTDPNVVAYIDDISITATTLGGAAYADELPELLITEMSAEPAKGYEYAEFIEIYNPTDRSIDLSQYSLMWCSISEGSADDYISGNQVKKYGGYQNLGEVIGENIYSGEFYVAEDKLRSFAKYDPTNKNNTNRYEFLDEDTDLNGGVRYNLVDGTYVKSTDGTGSFCRIRYIENWNTRYATSNYSYLLEPGECVIIFPMHKTNATVWTNGVNQGSLSRVIKGESLRSRYKNASRGITEDTKIIAINSFNLADEPDSGACGSRRYYIGKAYETVTNEDGSTEKVSIVYTNVYINDAKYDPYIVSYVDYNPNLIAGYIYEDTNPNDTNFGKGGSTETDNSKGFSGVWVYGVDGSDDFRRGTLYISNNKVTGSTSHVSRLAGYQQIILDEMYKKSDGTFADLSITEIVPRTYNLAGEDKSAFTAIELTNTSSKSVDLYNYALVRSDLSANSTIGEGFIHATVMQAGNPVIKGVGNGAYYYFMQNHISNPATCTLAPGETVVIWFITEDTYTSYSRDDDFGFDYFRQYWANRGNTQLALKGANGEYATKVVAVDGNVSTTANSDNAARVFDISPVESAVYGVANATGAVKQGIVKTEDVLSIAVLGSAFCYYNLEYTAIEFNGSTYYANVLTRTMPADTSMHYLVGVAGNSKASALADCMTVQYWEKSTGNAWYTVDVPGSPRYRLRNTSAMMEPRLGTLDGEETVAIADKLFISETAENGDVTYRYFDALRTGIVTVSGAAINTDGATPLLRFDNAVSNSVYNSLVSTYGSAVEIGMLIVKTDDLGNLTTFTEVDLINAGISYQKLESKRLYRSGDYTILSSSIAVGADDYNTSYTAIGYMKVKLNDSTTNTYWSAESTSRSLTDVVNAALADVSTTQDEVYCYTDMGAVEGSYSRYSIAVQLKLRAYVEL